MQIKSADNEIEVSPWNYQDRFPSVPRKDTSIPIVQGKITGKARKLELAKCYVAAGCIDRSESRRAQ